MKGSIGQRRFKLEWCSGCPNIPDSTDADIDNAVYVVESFNSLLAAERRGRELIRDRKDFFGCVSIEEQMIEIDRDVLKHEGWQRLVWSTLNRWVVDDADAKAVKA